jgi:uncharacterized membrane protein
MTANRPGQARAEDDEEHAGTSTDNSLGRLLTLSDGVFAIAMTLLAFNLKVPLVGQNPTNAELQHALAQHLPAYYSFGISFYVIANYWMRHRRLMRSVTIIDPALIGQTLFLLLCVAAMPFPADLLGQHGSDAISLVVYGALNAVAVLSLLRLHHIVRTRHLAPLEVPDPVHDDVPELLGSLGVFLLCIPAGYVFPGNGTWTLALLAVVPRVRPLWRRITLSLGDRAAPRKV